MDAVQASGRQIPCGLCREPVAEAAFRSGAARMFQGVLYCPTCSRDADRAREETSVFKQALEAGGLYSCGRCNAPVPIAAIRTGAVIYFSGVLSCAACSRDLRAVLLRQNRPAATPAPAAPAVPAAPQPLPRPSGRFAAPPPSPPPLPAPSQASLLPPLPGALPPRPGPLPTSSSQRFPAVPPLPNAAPPSTSSSQRFAAVPPLPGLPGPTPSTTSSQRLPAVSTTASQRLQAAPRPAEPPRSCAGCGASVAADEVTRGRALVQGSDIYCGSCRDQLDGILETSQADLARLMSFTCGGCGASVPAEDLVQEKALRYRGEVYCATCKADFGRSSVERAAGIPTKPAAATSVPEVVCVRCDRKIPPVEIRTGKALEVAGKLHCRHCRTELESAKAALERRMARAVACSHCARVVSPKEVQEKRVNYRDGNLICATCSRDPKIVLFGMNSVEDALPTLCKSCGETLTPSDVEVCRSCREKLEAIHSFSVEASTDLEKLATLPCDGCQAPVSMGEVSGWKAGVVDGGRVLCASCQARAPAKKAPKAPRCSRCRGPLPEGKKGATECEKCLDLSVEDDKDLDAAISLSTEIELRCAKCRRPVQHQDLISKRATSVGGRLTCASCRAAEVPTGGTKTGAASTEPKAGGKACGTCEGPIKGEAFAFSGRSFCGDCKPEFERLLRQSKISAPRACTACKKTAEGAEALEIEGRAFCASCKRAAEYLVICTVCERRRKPSGFRMPSGRVVAAAIAAPLVAFFILLAVSSRTSEAGTTVAVRPGPAVNQVALARGAALAAAQPSSYQVALANLAEVKRLAADDGNPNDGEIWQRYVAKATEARDRTVPLLANSVLDEASRAYARQSFPEEALTVLKTFPAELLPTVAGASVAAADAKYTKLRQLRELAFAALRSTAEDRHLAMGQVVESPEAARCGFLETEVGKRLDAEYRRARNAYEATHGAAPAPSPDPDSLARGDLLEKKGDVAGAEAAYSRALANDGDSVAAILGIIRCRLEREDYEHVGSLAERALALGRGRPDTAIITGWLTHLGLGAEDEDAAKTTAALKPLARADLGRLGRRLQAILSVGPPDARSTSWRLFAPGASKARVEEATHFLDSSIDRAVTAFHLPPALSRIDVFLFQDAGALSAFTSRLELLRAKGLTPASLPGCNAIALADPHAIVWSATTELGARAPAVPAWLVAGLANLPTLATNVSLPGKTPADPTPESPDLSIAALEKMDASTIARNPKALEAAVAYASVARVSPGDRKLGDYVARRGVEPKRAGAELEADLKRSFFRTSR